MRMWMIDPTLLCRKHLLGEHYEIHKAVGFLRNGRSLEPWVINGYLDPRLLQSRHDAIAQELAAREYIHSSPLDVPAINLAFTKHIRVISKAKAKKDLVSRCEGCRKLIEEATSGI